ncbi:protein phosphatase 2C-like domain-containing protein 1 isoform X1 [Hemicordylus capensis]|uniref:protein phosphatase 2C-like domain-containing protein 1 isoform X1 n=1 Tax=Hemicordylus capensis TaxID=884348 RepID=UPI0023049DD3|nr:protein phosphatase 2C-like domain-containing protein 1 isoform X1 [Hemicordylus capensis]XP_053120099.1 protein phosphatase 2C-like domain-containing protein 1 isoform X1 [Hemicordylus capensis]XP_053120100.1 protein phosphatase 2C-like domain-containing protein 1 isoform X1 [Hemicordylus capensis]XP_053120101.1 protein phosphatase 2C-like domain-containing protein 1 isoform X1 [Hemicordylus capensis]XP_053120103.1 protein phosphatase 2C-like domain-containing protein 1 isoform X1 [Hemicord
MSKRTTNSKLSQGEEDPTKVVKVDFKKVGRLDITILCSICQAVVPISQLYHHRKAHQAQAELDYKRPWVETIYIKKIALQRRQLISRMRKTSMYTERAREKIDCSLEFLLESLKFAPYFCINSFAQSSVHVEEVNSPLIKAIAICQDKNAAWHTDLEDVWVVLDNYGNKTGTCFLGLFDGSNGVSAADTTSAELPILFLEQLSRGDPSYQVSEVEQQLLNSFCTIFRADYRLREKIFTNKRLKGKTIPPNNYEWIHRAYAKAFWRMDRLLRLGRNEVSRVCWSSCTAATCLVETISNEKQKQNDQEREGMCERINNEKKQITQREEQQPERIRISTEKEKNFIKQEVAPTVSNQGTESIKGQQQEEKELPEMINKEASVSEPGELLASNKDRIEEKNVLENNHSSEQPDESSVGIMHIANIGNVHAVLCKNGESYWLTKEHTTYCTEEKIRVLQNGGYISSNEPKGLIEGLIRTTRGLGHHGNPALKKTVIPVPHTVSFPVDDSCQFLILASNGLWEALDKSEVVALTLIMFSAYLEKYQHAQLQKSCMPKTSATGDAEEDFYLWYLNNELFFTDVEDNQNNANLEPPVKSSSENEESAQLDSLRENMEEQEWENSSEESELLKIAESSEDTSSSEDSEEMLIGSDHQESQVLDERVDETVSDNPESSSQTSESEEADPRTFYIHAAKYISKHLVRAALKAGSRDNITVLVALLNGCDKIPTYV